jgi:large subunit ribosomal protein L24
VLPALRALMSGIPLPPIPAQIELASEQVMLGGRPLQDIAAELHGDGKSWRIGRLDFRAPGTTRVSLSEPSPKGASPDQFKVALNVESSDPDALMTWLQGRGDIVYRSQKPLRLRGDVAVSPAGFAIDAMKAEIDGGAIEGRVAVTHRGTNSGSKISAELKAERLDLDAAIAFARSLAGPQAEWPDEGHLALDIGRAVSAGQELRPLVARLGYGPKAFSLDQLNIGQLDKVALEGVGRFDRVASIGKLELNSTAASLGELTGLMAPFAPSLVARLNAMGTSAGPARVKLALALDKIPGRRIAPMHARQSISTRRSSRASPRSPRSRRYWWSTASTSRRSGAANSGSSQSCRPIRAARCWRCWVSIARSPRAMARSNSKARLRAVGVRRCGSKRKSREQVSTPMPKALPSRGHRRPKPVSA